MARVRFPPGPPKLPYSNCWPKKFQQFKQVGLIEEKSAFEAPGALSADFLLSTVNSEQASSTLRSLPELVRWLCLWLCQSIVERQFVSRKASCSPSLCAAAIDLALSTIQPLIYLLFSKTPQNPSPIFICLPISDTTAGLIEELSTSM